MKKHFFVFLSVWIAIQPAFAGGNRGSNRTNYVGNLIVASVKGGVGGTLIYLGTRKAEELSAALDKLSRAQEELASARALVTIEERASRIQAAERAIKAAEAAVENTSGIRAFRDGMGLVNVVANVISDRKKGGSGLNGAFQGNLQNEIIKDFVGGPDVEAEKKLAAAEAKMENAQALRTATAAERQSAISRAEAILNSAEGQAQAAKAKHAPRGAAKFWRVVGVVGGAILLLDTAGQLFSLATDDPSMSPILNMVIGGANAATPQDSKPAPEAVSGGEPIASGG